MKIGKLESVGLAKPVATDVEFFTPAGDRVMYVRRGEVDLSVKDLLGGRVGFDQARADGGEVVIDIREPRGTNVQDAFYKPEGEAKLELHNMHFEGMTVVLQMSGETRFVVSDLRGFMSVWRRDTPGARVSIGQVEGTFEEPEILGNKIELTGLDVQVWAQEYHTVELDLVTKIGKGGIKAHLDYYQRDEDPAELTLEPDVGGGALIAAAATNVRSWFTGKLNVTVDDVKADTKSE